MHEPARRQPFSVKLDFALAVAAAFFFARIFQVSGADVGNASLPQELQAARIVEASVLAKKATER